MKDFLKKNKISLLIVGYIIFLALFFYFLIFSFVGKIAEKADLVQQNIIDREINNKRLADVPAMEENYKKFKDNEQNLDMIVDPADEVSFIKYLESLAEQTGNKIQIQIKDAPAPVSKQKGSEEDIKNKLTYSNYLSTQVALEGNYPGLLNFIHKLENSSRFVNILAVSSEKKTLESTASTPVSSNPFSKNNPALQPAAKEILNSILDLAVYIKK